MVTRIMCCLVGSTGILFSVRCRSSVVPVGDKLAETLYLTVAPEIGNELSEIFQFITLINNILLIII